MLLAARNAGLKTKHDLQKKRATGNWGVFPQGGREILVDRGVLHQGWRGDLWTGDCRVATFIPTSPKQSQKIKNKGKRAALPDSAGGGYQSGEVGLCFMQPTQRV